MLNASLFDVPTSGTIPPERMQKLQHLLSRSNKCAKRLSQRILGNRKYLLFREVMRNNVKGESAQSLTPRQRRLMRAIPASQKQLIRHTDEVRKEIMEGYIGLILDAAKRASELVPGFVRDELVGEAALFLSKAINNYIRTDVKFITYATIVLTNELRRYMLVNNPFKLCANSSDCIQLVRDIGRIEQEILTRSGSIDLHTVVAALYKLPMWHNVKHLTERVMGVMGYVQYSGDTTASEDVPLAETAVYHTDIDTLIDREEFLAVTHLTSTEYDYMVFHSARQSPEEIASVYKVSPKSVEEVIQIAKEKIRRVRRLAAA